MKLNILIILIIISCSPQHIELEGNVGYSTLNLEITPNIFNDTLTHIYLYNSFKKISFSKTIVSSKSIINVSFKNIPNGHYNCYVICFDTKNGQKLTIQEASSIEYLQLSKDSSVLISTKLTKPIINSTVDEKFTNISLDLRDLRNSVKISYLSYSLNGKDFIRYSPLKSSNGLYRISLPNIQTNQKIDLSLTISSSGNYDKIYFKESGFTISTSKYATTISNNSIFVNSSIDLF